MSGISFRELDPHDRYKLLCGVVVPRPIALVTTLDENGKVNAAPFSFFNVWRTLGGILGMAICNDRRWPETYRVMGLQGVEMVLIGYNTPSANPEKRVEALEKRMFHNRLSLQAGAYQNSTWVVGVAKAGIEDGHPLFGGSLIVNPDGEIVVEAKTEEDELLVYPCDLDATDFGKKTIFNFANHRRIEHYGLITSRTGAVPPPEN